MENKTKDFLKILGKIWLLVLMSYSLFSVLIFYLSKYSDLNYDKEMNAAFLYISIFSIFSLLPLSYYVYGLLAKKAKKIESESQKLDYYRRAFIYKIALIEASGLLPLLAYYFSKQVQCLMMAAISILIFFISKPSETRFKEDFYENNIPDKFEN
jgi:hypothetical protein